MKVKTATAERIPVEGTTALIERPGYANAARFILLNGEKEKARNYILANILKALSCR